MQKTLLLIIMIGWVIQLEAQVEGLATGARSSAMNNTGLGVSDVWANRLNQAGLAEIHGVEAGVFYHNQFGLSELGTGGLALATRLGAGGIGLDFQSFGYTAYRQSDAGISYGLELGGQLNVGIRLGFRQIRLGSNYGQTFALTAEGGFQFALNKDVVISGHLANPQRNELVENEIERIPSVLRTGVQWGITSTLIFNTEIRKDVNYPAAVLIGIEYSPIQGVFVMGGAGSGPDQFAFGAGLQRKNFRMDMAASYHQILGFSPQISIAFHGQKS